MSGANIAIKVSLDREFLQYFCGIIYCHPSSRISIIQFLEEFRSYYILKMVLRIINKDFGFISAVCIILIDTNTYVGVCELKLHEAILYYIRSEISLPFTQK